MTNTIEITHYDFTSGKILYFMHGRLTSPDEKRLHVRLSNDHRNLVLDAFTPDDTGMNRIVLRPSYTKGDKETQDKITLTIFPETRGIKRQDVITFLGQLVNNDKIFQNNQELENKKLEEWKDILKRQHLKRSSKLVCSIISKNKTPDNVLDAFFGYMLEPCIFYTKHMGEYSR